MCNTINKERENSEKYFFKLDTFDYNEDTKLVKLTSDNVSKVEAMILIDSTYRKSCDVLAEPIGKYQGSTAFWMTELKKHLNDKNDTNTTFEKTISGAVAAVDRENSTHLNTEKNNLKNTTGRERITQIIVEVGKDKLKKMLKANDLELFNMISAPKNGGRNNQSFASKFCHYACYYLFDGEEAQDKYSIFDKVVREALPYYLKYYDIKFEKKRLGNI